MICRLQRWVVRILLICQRLILQVCNRVRKEYLTGASRSVRSTLRCQSTAATDTKQNRYNQACSKQRTIIHLCLLKRLKILQPKYRTESVSGQMDFWVMQLTTNV